MLCNDTSPTSGFWAQSVGAVNTQTSRHGNNGDIPSHPSILFPSLPHIPSLLPPKPPLLPPSLSPSSLAPFSLPPPPFSVAPCLQTNMQPGMNGVLMGCAGLLLIKRCATSLFCLYKTSAPVRVSTAFCGFCLGGEERGVCSTNAEAASYSGKR